MGTKIAVWQFLQPLRCFTFEFISAWLIRNQCHANQHYTKSLHYSDIITTLTVSRITGVSIVCSFCWSGEHHRKHQSSASLASAGNPQLTGWFPIQRASSTEKSFHLMTSSWNNKTYFAPDAYNKNRPLFSKLDGKNHIFKFSIDWEIRTYLD